MGLIPTHLVEDGVEILLDEVNSLGLDDHEADCMTAFTDYFIDTWFEGKFPIAMWNHYDNTGPRTNNHVEGYNAKLNKLLTKPNIWRFIAKLTNEEANNNIKYVRLEKGTYKSRGRNKADCERDLKIEQAKTKWLNKELDDLNDYLNLLAHIIYDHKF